VVKGAGPDGALRRPLTDRGFNPSSFGEQMSFEAVKHEHLISHYDEALKNQNLTAQDRELQ